MQPPSIGEPQEPSSPESGPYRVIARPLLSRFSEAAPELLARRGLLRRTDSKFLIPQHELGDLLVKVVDHYGILRAAGEQIADYRTLYFDTPDLRCFHDHRRGRRARHKVRIRHYTDRKVSFLEIKSKRSAEITSKKRRPKPYGQSSLDADDLEFISQHCNVPAGALLPQIGTDFQRLTLVGLDVNERVTLDTELQLRDGEKVVDLRGICILEVKQSPFCVRTPIMRVLRSQGLRPVSASKYCTAVVLNRQSVRFNRLLPALRAIERMKRG